MIETKNSLFLGLAIFILSTVLFTSCDDNPTSSAYTGVRVIDNSFSPTVVTVSYTHLTLQTKRIV